MKLNLPVSVAGLHCGGAWMPTTKVRRLAPVPTGGYGTSLSIDRTTAVNQFAGAARGVPPRGKPD